MAEYVKFTVPAELSEKQYQIIEKAAKTGKIRIGSNETTKAIEREKAKFVLIAEDTSPPEVVMHIPLICEEKNIPYSYVATKKDLGQKAGIHVGTSSIAIVEEGDAKKDLDDLVKKIQELKK